MRKSKKITQGKFIPEQKQDQNRPIHNMILFCKLVGISFTGIISAYSSNAVLNCTITAAVWSVCEIIDAELAKHNENKYYKLLEEVKKSKIDKQPLP